MGKLRGSHEGVIPHTGHKGFVVSKGNGNGLFGVLDVCHFRTTLCIHPDDEVAGEGFTIVASEGDTGDVVGIYAEAHSAQHIVEG